MKYESSSISSKQNYHHALKDISEALEQTTNYSERYKWRSMSSQIIMQLCEDSLTFNNFRYWYSIKTQAKQNKMTF